MGGASSPTSLTMPPAADAATCGGACHSGRKDEGSQGEALQSLLGGKVGLGFKIASALALLWYFSSFFFPIHIPIGGKSVPINAAAGSYLIPLFGIFRYRQETDAYQKQRIVWIVGLYLLLWVVVPALLGFREMVPQLDGRGRVFPAIHFVESLGFLLFFIPILLLGRRADCGWCCPCVASRETFAAAFRNKTLKGEAWWWLRYLKWINVAAVLLFLAFLLIRPETAYQTYGMPLYAYLLGSYYLSFLFIPWTGSRNFCRWGCPWGGIWGGLGYIGFYRLRADWQRCTDCGLCEKVCDMGIPVRRFIREKGPVRTPECMGCGRCVNACPAEALEICDARDWLRKKWSLIVK